MYKYIHIYNKCQTLLAHLIKVTNGLKPIYHFYGGSARLKKPTPSRVWVFSMGVIYFVEFSNSRKDVGNHQLYVNRETLPLQVFRFVS